MRGDAHRYGQAHGLQRYRCTACGKTFKALMGTPLARLRHKAKWLDYLQCMLDSKTIRQAAAANGVHRNTSFRWRQRFLKWAKDDRPTHLHGITENDETYLLESDKGARKLMRAARKRGGSTSKRGLSDEQVCVLVARDRTGQTLDFVTGKGSVTKAQLLACLPSVLDADILLVSDANTTYRYFGADIGITHESVNLSAGVRVKGAFHVQNVNATPITAACTSGSPAFTAWPPVTCRTTSAGDVHWTPTVCPPRKPCCVPPSAFFHKQR